VEGRWGFGAQIGSEGIFTRVTGASKLAGWQRRGNPREQKRWGWRGRAYSKDADGVDGKLVDVARHDCCKTMMVSLNRKKEQWLLRSCRMKTKLWKV